MDIDKTDDSHSLLYQGQEQAYPSAQPRVMAVPEVSAPMANPLMMLWRRKGVLLLVVLACVGAALVKYMFSQQVFRSEARLFVQTPSGGGELKTGPEIGNSASQGALRAQCEVIKSAKILAGVLAQPEIAEFKTFASGSRWQTLKENLSATVGNDDIIMVSFDSPYPAEAQAVLDAVVDAYSNFYTKEKRSHVAELEKWRNKSQAELEKKQKDLLEFKKANGGLVMAGGDRGNATLQKLDNLQRALTEAHLNALDAKSTCDSAKAKLNDPAQVHNLVEYFRSTGMSIENDANAQALRSQLLSMEAQAEELGRRYLPSHPSVRAAQATISSLRSRIAEMDRSLAETYLLAMEQKVTTAAAREKELQQAYDEQNKVAVALNLKAAEADQLEGEIKRLSASVEKADLQLVDLSATENVGVPNVLVLDKPRTPDLPVRPVRNTMLLQGLVLGLVLGCFAAILRDVTDQGLRSSEEIIETLGVPLLGSVPHMAGPPNPIMQGRKVDFEPSSDVAETYRTIRTAVFFGTPDRESRTILVTSPAPNDGKSTFASNLAIAMAQQGKRVLLVDADFRKSVQHRIFETRPGIGLSSVLAGHEPLEKAIQSTGISGLDILPAGPQPGNPSEILNSQSFNEVLEELSVRYEHVVLDSPPVMAVADARILSAMCSVTILVLRAQHSTRKAAVPARRALQSVGAVIMGVVVNDVPRARDRYGEFGSYSGYRAATTNGGEQGAATGGYKVNAIVPARSFLDLRRK